MDSEKQIKKVALFDVDGTLTPARKPMLPDMIECLDKVRAAGVSFVYLLLCKFNHSTLSTHFLKIFENSFVSILGNCCSSQWVRLHQNL